MSWVDPHGRHYHDERDCDHADQSLMKLPDERVTEYGYYPCVCASDSSS